MAKMLRCRDAGVDCDAVIRAETEEELMRKVAEHAKTVHGMLDGTVEKKRYRRFVLGFG